MFPWLRGTFLAYTKVYALSSETARVGKPVVETEIIQIIQIYKQWPTPLAVSTQLAVSALCIDRAMVAQVLLIKYGK